MHRKNPNRKFSLRFGKEEMSTEDKRRRLRRLVPSWSFLTCLRRPPLFRFAGKEGGEKGRWVTVLCILPLNSSGPQCFGLAFHSIVTSCVSDYAPPDTGVSDLQLPVASGGPFFSVLPEKKGEKRGAWGRGVLPASEFRREAMFHLALHSILTSRAS